MAKLAIEDAVCPDIPCSGIDHIEKLGGGLVRIVLYVDHVEPDGQTVRVVCGKLLGPLCSLPAAIKLLGLALLEGVAFIVDSQKSLPLN